MQLNYRKFNTGFYSLYDEFELNTIFKCKWFNYSLKVKEGSDSFGGKKNPELIIYANDERGYEKALRLFIASLFLTDCTPAINYEKFLPSYQEIFPNEEVKYKAECVIRGIPLALKILKQVSYHRYLQNSVYKYKLGCEIHSNNPMQLNPDACNITNYEYFIDDRIRYANSIVIFYSIVEELGLGINLKKGIRSIEDDVWNSEVLNKLQESLIKNKIDIEKPILWLRRYKPSKVETKRKVHSIRKATWAAGHVRDDYIRIEDAIDFLRTIRNKVAAHSLKPEYEKLTVFDVENANFLVKRLLLEKMGLW